MMIKVVTTRFTLYSSRVCMRYHMRMSIPARSPTHYVALVQALGAKSFAGGGRQSAVSECAELVAAVLQRREDRSTVGHDVRMQTKQTVASEVITRHVDDHARSSSRTPSSPQTSSVDLLLVKPVKVRNVAERGCRVGAPLV